MARDTSDTEYHALQRPAIGDDWDAAWDDLVATVDENLRRSGTLANRPSASDAPDDAWYEATDEGVIYRNDPANGWVAIAVKESAISHDGIDQSTVASDDHHTRYSDSEAAAAAPVQSVFGRTGDVVAKAGDYAASQISNFSSAVLSAIDGSSISPSSVSTDNLDSRQGYDDVTGSRSLDMWEDNATGADLDVNIAIESDDTNQILAVLDVNDVQNNNGVYQVRQVPSNSGDRWTLTATVPAGHYYKLRDINGNVSVLFWREQQ